MTPDVSSAAPVRLGEPSDPAAPLPEFAFAEFVAAYDVLRRDRGLGWYEFADELWHQSAELNADLGDHPLCGGAVSRLAGRGETSCQYALFMLRWMRRAPEDFLIGPVRDVGDTALPEPGVGRRLRWDLASLHTAVDARRNGVGFTWRRLGEVIGCTPSRLTNLKNARQADLALCLRLTQWVGRPAAAFVQAARW